MVSGISFECDDCGIAKATVAARNICAAAKILAKRGWWCGRNFAKPSQQHLCPGCAEKFKEDREVRSRSRYVEGRPGARI